ncbi:VOC family protein [Fodinicola acaciae]|uniref:VOC family protein n=1 Tax=Fodinicola acaciae TaxID=2681555 RepID=UPI0013D07B1C|nr:VOC family protein [Fodinicola acaciae]
MAIATFRDHIVDAIDAPASARFWSRVLGQPIREDVVALVGGPTLWVNDVPEPKTVKNRVHLDLRMPHDDPKPLVELGATIDREPTADDRWWVMRDPEGNEFCAFAPVDFHRPDTYEVFEMVVDSVDGHAQAAWWAEVLGGTVGSKPTFAWVEGAAGFPWRYFVFGDVPEPKTVKNRWHWDVELPPGEDVSKLVAAGATVLRERDDDIQWTIMADPEGNEFCAFETTE